MNTECTRSSLERKNPNLAFEVVDDYDKDSEEEDDELDLDIVS